jgi:predicted nucleic acid-binding protein
MIIVIDASVAAKWFFQEEHSEYALSLLGNRFELNAPDFLYLELENLLCKRTRRKELSITEALEMEDEIISMPISSYSSTELRERAFELALDIKSSLYDCLYLALAEALDGRMVTADGKFFQALCNSPLSDRMLWVGDLPGA